MRISDLLMSKSYLNDVSSMRSKMDKISNQIANQSSILKPSDSPTGTAKVLRLTKQLSSADLYMKNIQNSLGFVDESIRGLESIESNISNVLVKLTEVNNSTNTDNYSTFAQQIDQILDSLVDSANISFDGKYVFGGTDFGSKPYSITSDRSAVKLNVNDVSGESKIKISANTTQVINLPGAEVFGTILKQNGTFDEAAAVGSSVNDTIQIYDSYNNPFDLELTYTKSAANTYDLEYDIKDSLGNTIYGTPPDAVELKFDDYTGNLVSVDGKEKTSFFINESSHSINFSINLNSLNEGSTASALSLNANQDLDIFNTLIKIRDDLENGIKPADADVQTISTFHKRLLNNMSDAGYIYNNLENSKTLLENQKIEIQRMISEEKDLDLAKAIMEMQNYDYLLQVSYKLSSMILPKSLMDFL